MAASVLGKRSHAATDWSARPTRSKRRIVLNELNDENENPFVRAKHVEEEEEKETVAVAGRPKKSIRRVNSRVGPAESTTPLSISPSKVRTARHTAKASVTVLEDDNGNRDAAPRTPRHRDAVSNKIAITPRHRALLNATPVTPRSPRTPSHGGIAIYNQARQLFSRCSNPGRIIGRDAERAEISTFVNSCLELTSTGCMYVSGPPGTGKSALVQEVLKQFDDVENLSRSTVNCMSIRNATDLITTLSIDLGLMENAGLEYLQSTFRRSKAANNHKYLVVLDEVDRLVDIDLELLYNLFEWSMQASSRLILIGIANALDLTDRLLPRLKSRRLQPELLPFMPYSAGQIAEVLTAKLKSLVPSEMGSLPFFQPAAIQFCAKKIGSQTGDLRKAFDVCRRAVDVVEQETKQRDLQLSSPTKTPLMENVNLSSPPTPRSLEKKQPPTYSIESAPKATIAHVAKATAQVFGNGLAQRMGTLTLQQKAVMCALVVLQKGKRDNQLEGVLVVTPSKLNPTAPSIRELYESYNRLCRRDNLLQPLTSGEFRDVMSGLEALDLLSVGGVKAGSGRSPVTPSRTPSRLGKRAFGVPTSEEKEVASKVGYGELFAALDGPAADLLKEITDWR